MENKLHTKQPEIGITTVVQDTVQKMTSKVKNLTNDVADLWMSHLKQLNV